MPRRIAFHGGIVLLVALLCGSPFFFSITKDWGAEAIRGWRAAHLSLLASGTLILALAAVYPLLVLGPKAAKTFFWSIVGVAYGNMVALLTSAIFGVRGLEPVGPASNLFANACATVGAVASLVLAVVVIMGARTPRNNNP